ncbi:hypothetical protein BJ508DRAFT_328869 [Ascobolus immersus RN42]|uniref:F-box domain-containing protein n=1 Tax=Ascobolus immersus RN42 TaxID=1160509 RepID=A0A3N4HYS3_ASCIM|nr:hypothetical protein BJ508DRAFT_328869 [Ascobolus immersus RN42]
MQHTTTPTSKSHLHLLNLPCELRLEIYSWTPAFSLLQLSCTHPRIRAELVCRPGLFTKVYGYEDLRDQFYHRRPWELQILFIHQFVREEVDLFIARYSPFPKFGDAGYKVDSRKDRRRRFVCRVCLKIRRGEDFRDPSNLGPEWVYFWEACRKCHRALGYPALYEVLLEERIWTGERCAEYLTRRSEIYGRYTFFIDKKYFTA